MTPQHVLVTGAGGYVGRHVVTALLDLGHRVTAAVRPGSRSNVDERATVVKHDLLRPGFDPVILTDDVPTVLVHLAWQDGFNHNAPSHMQYVSAHYEFLRAASTWGVKRIAALGTMHEVGYWEGAIDEKTPTDPLSLYGIAKDALRRAILKEQSDDLTIQWLRCFYIYGDDRNNRSIFTRLLEAADEGKTAFPFTSGKNKYDFIDVRDLGAQIATVATQDAVRGIINCCSGVPVSLADKVEEFIAANSLGITLEYGAFPDRPYDSPAEWGDANAIQSLMSR